MFLIKITINAWQVWVSEINRSQRVNIGIMVVRNEWVKYQLILMCKKVVKIEFCSSREKVNMER